MILFPAIDILNGECVRLAHGNYSDVTKYGNPVSAALKWVGNGAKYLHVVDLNAAKSGKSENLEIIKEIAAVAGIPVQTGGGVRTLDDAEARLSAGVRRVVFGTVCCENPELIRLAVVEFGAERVVCGIDVKNGRVATRGWLNQSNISPFELGKVMFAHGARYAVFTDVSKDGALTGVNADACKGMAEKTGLNIIASGGISGIADISTLKNMKMYGAILGKALYENRISLEEAAKTAEEI